MRAAVGRLQAVKAHVASIEAAFVSELGRRGDRTSLAASVGKTEASRLQRRSELLEQSPGLADALSAGEVSASHVDVLAAVTKQMPVLLEHPDELLELATSAGPDRVRERSRLLGDLWAADGGLGRFERQRQAVRLVRRVDDVTGMHHFGLDLDPERAAMLNAQIDQRVERSFHAGEHIGMSNDQRTALALFELAATGSGDGGRMAVSMAVAVDAETLLQGVHERSVIDLDGGGIVPAETLRRFACDAEILPVVMGGPSQVVDVGRAQRMATAKQRAVLRLLHPSCGAPECTVPFEHCNIHHVRWWRHGGPTDLANMIPLCSRHHHDVHEGGWIVAIGPERAIGWNPPP